MLKNILIFVKYAQKERMILMDIVKNILNIAKLHNYTDKRLCELLEKNPSYISDWKNGKSKPKADEIILLATEFNVSTDYLLGFNNPQPTNARDITNNNGVIGGVVEHFNGGHFETTNKNKCSLTKQEQDLLRIYNSVDGKKQMKIMSCVYSIEEE